MDWDDVLVHFRQKRELLGKLHDYSETVPIVERGEDREIPTNFLRNLMTKNDAVMAMARMLRF